MTTIIVSAIMAARPCEGYPESRVRALVGDGLTPRQLAALDIPAEDRLWALIMCAMDDRQRRLLACDCAERALGRVENPDPRSLQAVAVSRRYAYGDATDDELAAALDAAWDAARDAAGDAAGDAAWAAACSWMTDRLFEYIASSTVDEPAI